MPWHGPPEKPTLADGPTLISLNPSSGKTPSRFSCLAFLIKNTSCLISMPSSLERSLDLPLHCSQAVITSNNTSSLTFTRLPLLDLKVLSRLFICLLYTSPSPRDRQ